MGFNPNEVRVPKGRPGGGRWGAARDAKAAQAQKNVGAQHHYTQIRATPPAKRAAYVKGMSDADLEALTAMLYSYKSSDPDVVNARIAVANEMNKRGLDIKKYGALGGGMQAMKKKQARAAAVKRVVAAAKKTPVTAAAPAPVAKPLGRSGPMRAL